MYVAKSKYYNSVNHARTRERFSWRERSQGAIDNPDKKSTDRSNKKYTADSNEESIANSNKESAASSKEPTSDYNKESTDSSNKESATPKSKASYPSLTRNGEGFSRRDRRKTAPTGEFKNKSADDGFNDESAASNQCLSRASSPSNSKDNKPNKSKQSQIVADNVYVCTSCENEIVSQKRNETDKKIEVKKSMTIIKPAPENFGKSLDVVDSQESILDEGYCKNFTPSVKPLSMAAKAIQSQLSNTLGSVKRFLVSKLEECVQSKSCPICQGYSSQHNHYCHHACVCQNNSWTPTHCPCHNTCLQHYPCKMVSSAFSCTVPSNYNNISQNIRGNHNFHEQRNGQFSCNDQATNSTKPYNVCSAIVTSNNSDAMKKEICNAYGQHEDLGKYQNEHSKDKHVNHDKVIFQNPKQISNLCKSGLDEFSFKKGLNPAVKYQQRSLENEMDSSSLSDVSKCSFTQKNKSPLNNLRMMKKRYSREKTTENLAKLLIAQYEVNGKSDSNAMQSKKFRNDLTPRMIMSNNSVQVCYSARKLRPSKGKYRQCTNSKLKKSCLRPTEKWSKGHSPFRLYINSHKASKMSGFRFSSSRKLSRYGCKVGHASHGKNRSCSSYYTYTTSAYSTDRSVSDISRTPKRTLLYDSGYNGSTNFCQKRMEPEVKRLESDDTARKERFTNYHKRRRTKHTISFKRCPSSESKIVEKQKQPTTKNDLIQNDACFSFHSMRSSASERGDEGVQKKTSDVKDQSQKRVSFRNKDSFIKEKYSNDWHLSNHNQPCRQKMCSNHRSSTRYTSQCRLEKSKKKFIRMKIRQK